MFAQIFDRFFHNGYLAALERALRAVMARYARGNIGIQDERLLSPEDADALHRKAAKASKRMNKRIARYRA